MLAHLAICSLGLFQGKAKAPIKAPPPPPAFAYGLVGVTDFPGPFDPAALLKDAPEDSVRLWREAELMHARVGMLAAAGFLVQESFHPLFGGTVTGPAINHIPQIPPFFWAVLSFGIGIAEAYRIQIGCAWPPPPPAARAHHAERWHGNILHSVRARAQPDPRAAPTLPRALPPRDHQGPTRGRPTASTPSASGCCATTTRWATWASTLWA